MRKWQLVKHQLSPDSTAQKSVDNFPDQALKKQN